MNVGDSVTSGSSTENIVVQGTGGYEVSTTVRVDKLTAVAVGQAATVLPDGSHTDITGKVVSISVMPDPSSTTTTSYRVVVGLTNPNAKLNNGATGTVSIMTGNAKSALAVPTSAITTTGARHFVTVLDGGNPTRVAVQVGVLGNTWTEIKSGVKPGEQVVLANVSAALPSSATASTNATQNSGTSRFGGFGGGGFGGAGGFGGGGFGGGGNRTRLIGTVGGRCLPTNDRGVQQHVRSSLTTRAHRIGVRLVRAAAPPRTPGSDRRVGRGHRGPRRSRVGTVRDRGRCADRGAERRPVRHRLRHEHRRLVVAGEQREQRDHRRGRGHDVVRRSARPAPRAPSQWVIASR